MSHHVGVVGGGAAGIGVAHALRERDADVTILESRSELGGRAASRSRNGCRYEVGANYLSTDDRTEDLLERLGGAVAIDGPVWTFDREGTISASDRQKPRWTWEGGLAEVGTRLLAGTDASVERETTVNRLAREGEGWLLSDERGGTHGYFEAVVLTPPAPQTASLLAGARWQDERLVSLREAAGTVPYRTIRTAALHYPFELDRPWYALVNDDREHEVGWLAREERKPGHVPDGESLLVAQMNSAWSREHFEDSAESAAEAAAAAVADLLGDDRLRHPDWTDERRWRDAIPDARADPEVMGRSADAGLYFAGDWLVGEGRVHRALWNGVETGERLAERLRR
ncbi:MAG: NAD(P)/FAD-dependent oxidoreductase [Salinigranum sp.]